MLDSPERVCAGQVRFEYPATSVPFSKTSKGLRRGWRLGRLGGPGGWASYWGQEQRRVELAESPTGADDPVGGTHNVSSTGWSLARDR
jgi:hypothetical protein